jgi:ribosomal protein S14
MSLNAILDILSFLYTPCGLPDTSQRFLILALAEFLGNRCEVSGRPHGVYRKLRISRIALRDMASAGKIPGMTKSSW